MSYRVLNQLSPSNIIIPSVHTTLISRIHQYLPEDIQADEYLPFLLTGAFFPDAFYTCGSPDTSEAAHWPPFIKAGIDYIHNTGIYPTKQQLELKAFLYGVFTHQVADSSWHSIRLHQGLLTMLAHMDFDGDADRAHQFLDTAADFLLLNRIDDMTFHRAAWKYPNFTHLKRIFARVGIKVNEFDLRYCTARGESALNAETRAHRTTAMIYAEMSPLLEDCLDEYYLGGLKEIELSIARCMPNLNDWFENETPANSWSLCDAIPPKPLTTHHEDFNMTMESSGTILSPYVPISNFGHAIAVGNFLAEASLAISSQYEDGSGSVYIVPLSPFTNTDNTHQTITIKSPSSSFDSPKRFGASMLTYVLFGESFLFISEPGSSSIYVYSGNQRILTITDARSSSSFGSSGVKQEGISLYSRDIDGDGFAEVFIGNPYADVHPSAQSGEVLVLSGKLLSVLLISGEILSVDISQLVIHRLLTSENYALEDGYDQFGSVVTGDAQMIYISANGAGIVYCYDFSLQLKKVLSKSTTPVVVGRKASPASELYGKRFIVAEKFGDTHFLVVGAPGHSDPLSVSCGAVYIYKLQGDDVVFHTKLVLKAGVGNSLAKFGYQGIVYDDVLYISAPGYHRSGAVFKVNLADVFTKDIPSMLEVTHIAVESSAGYSGFGESLNAFNRYLFIGEPNFGYGEMFDDTKKMTGRIGIYPIR